MNSEKGQKQLILYKLIGCDSCDHLSEYLKKFLAENTFISRISLNEIVHCPKSNEYLHLKGYPTLLFYNNGKLTGGLEGYLIGVDDAEILMMVTQFALSNDEHRSCSTERSKRPTSTDAKLGKGRSYAQNRAAICAQCDNLRVFGFLKICSSCGCLIDLKVRTKNAACPLDKWATTKP